jgi:MFS family permease
MRVPGFPRLYAGLLLGRVSGTMVTVALVLFVLTRYHSPQLAGATAFFAIFPGLLVSPLAGALLDRKGRSRLVVLDYSLAAVAVGLIAALSALHSLPPALLLVIVGVSSLTNPLSSAGARTLFPILVPEELWERANGMDSSGHVLATLVGAPLAGTLVGWIGGEWALAAAGVLFVGAALVMIGLPDPPAATETHGNVLRNAWLGLKFVVQNPTLRGMAFTLSLLNLGWGILDIAVPVILLGRLHQGPAVVGYLWGALGAAGLVSALLAGRVPTQGRERQIMLGGILLTAAAMASIPFATNVAAIAIALIVMGGANGPFDISFFTLRQRRTPPAWFGRAFAVSMSLNFVGTPIGSALAGTLIGRSVDVAMWTAVAVVLVAGIFPMLTIPARDDAVAPAKAAT